MIGPPWLTRYANTKKLLQTSVKYFWDMLRIWNLTSRNGNWWWMVISPLDSDKWLCTICIKCYPWCLIYCKYEIYYCMEFPVSLNFYKRSYYMRETYEVLITREAINYHNLAVSSIRKLCRIINQDSKKYGTSLKLG